MKISEIDLEQIGFSKVVVTPEEAGTPLGYYYYELELSDTNPDFCLISMESDKVVDDIWFVKLFQVDDFELRTRDELRDFVLHIFKFKKHTK